jgi:hypothetical protein
MMPDYKYTSSNVYVRKEELAINEVNIPQKCRRTMPK